MFVQTTPNLKGVYIKPIKCREKKMDLTPANSHESKPNFKNYHVGDQKFNLVP